MKKYISKFHYLTQDMPQRSHIEQVKIACVAGANWIQYRCLSKTDSELLADINEIAQICDDWGATLIITNHYHLLHQADVQGVHIENMQADFNIIRKYIGDDKTIGGSANTFEDIKRWAASGLVDYFGCGPFSVTLTKPNDYPLLGANGYFNIINQMIANGIELPVLAVGGIAISDVDALLENGVYGVAVSAAVNLSADPGEALKAFRKKLY